jgi:hypothetical protein
MDRRMNAMTNDEFDRLVREAGMWIDRSTPGAEGDVCSCAEGLLRRFAELVAE